MSLIISLVLCVHSPGVVHAGTLVVNGAEPFLMLLLKAMLYLV